MDEVTSVSPAITPTDSRDECEAKMHKCVAIQLQTNRMDFYL